MTVAAKTMDARAIDEWVNRHRQAHARWVESEGAWEAREELDHVESLFIYLLLQLHDQKGMEFGRIFGHIAMAVTTPDWLVVVSPLADPERPGFVLCDDDEPCWQLSIVPRHEGLITLD
jgi:hypothetical protein